MNRRIRLRVLTTLVRVGLAAGLFAAAAAGSQLLLGPGQLPPTWAVISVIVAVAAVLAAIQPVLERISYRIGFGRQASAEELMDELLRKMATAIPVDEVLVRLAETVGDRQRPATVRVLLADGSSLEETWAPPQVQLGVENYRVAVQHGADQIGQLTVSAGAEPLTGGDRRRLDELSNPAGVALSAVRLTLDLQQREAQLAATEAALLASTSRLRLARAEQQQRLQQEVADLVTPQLDLAAAELAAPERCNPEVVRSAAAQALDQLRTLARGIHPPRLAEDGLIASLRGWLEHRQLSAVVTGTESIPLPEPSLRAGYFCLVLLLSALAAAPATELSVDIATASGDEIAGSAELAHPSALGAELRFTVGGKLLPATAPAESTIQLVRDRLAAYDGSLESTLQADQISFVGKFAS